MFFLKKHTFAQNTRPTHTVKQMSNADCELELLLQSADGDAFRVNTYQCRVSGFLMHVLRDATPKELDEPIPLPTVPSKYLGIIVQYLRNNATQPFTRIRKPVRKGDLSKSFIPEWVSALLCPLEDAELLELHNHAAVMQIFMLEMASAAIVAWRWKMLSEDECMTKLGRSEPLTSIEQESIFAKYAWAFQEAEDTVVEDPVLASACV